MSIFELPKLKLRERTGAYATGKARILQILETAHDLMIEEGFQAVTLREIARRCDINVGAVSYYYKSRSDLMRDLLDSAINPYFDLYDKLVEDPAFPVEERFERLIRAVLEDIQTEKTTKLFPELWTAANRDASIAELVDQIYVRQRTSYERLIKQMNPALHDEQRAALTLFVSASIEGQTMFVGFEKPYARLLPQVENVAIRSLVTLVKTITNEDINRVLPPLRDNSGPLEMVASAAKRKPRARARKDAKPDAADASQGGRRPSGRIRP